MRLRVQITRHADGRRSFLVWEDIRSMHMGILGRGWTLPDAVEEFLEEYNRWAFFDDNTPAMISRDDISLGRPSVILEGGDIS